MIKSDEAWSLFQKWYLGSTTIVCMERRFDASVSLRGTVVSLSSEEARFSSLDKNASLILHFGRGLEFEYAAPTELPEAVPDKILSILAVILPLRVTLPFPDDLPDREKMFFLELETLDESE